LARGVLGCICNATKKPLKTPKGKKTCPDGTVSLGKFGGRRTCLQKSTQAASPKRGGGRRPPCGTLVQKPVSYLP